MNYLEALAAEIRAEVPHEALPPDDTTSLFVAYAVLLLAKGGATTPEDVHNAWVAWMLDREEVHESMVPFSNLPADTQEEDSPFTEAIHQVARRSEA